MTPEQAKQEADDLNKFLEASDSAAAGMREATTRAKAHKAANDASPSDEAVSGFNQATMDWKVENQKFQSAQAGVDEIRKAREARKDEPKA